jgi:hypothetical protein
MLTKKNLLVSHSVLRLGLEGGGGPYLLTSWGTLLTTLQHLCWVCGIVAKSSADFIAHQVARLGISEHKQNVQSSSSSSSVLNSGEASGSVTSTQLTFHFILLARFYVMPCVYDLSLSVCLSVCHVVLCCSMTSYFYHSLLNLTLLDLSFLFFQLQHILINKLGFNCDNQSYRA